MENKKINLWNLTDGKTRSVMEYIKNKVVIHDTAVSMDDHKFDSIKSNALSKNTANGMLETIGFNPIGRDKIYDWCSERR